MQGMITRRSAVETLAVSALAGSSTSSARAAQGRLKQSVSRWC
jgi:hypothetical protein